MWHLVFDITLKIIPFANEYFHKKFDYLALFSILG